LADTLHLRTGEVTGQLESLSGRIEAGLDTGQSIGDTLALRTLEFSRVVGDTGNQLLGSLESKVENFSTRLWHRSRPMLQSLKRRPMKPRPASPPALTREFEHLLRAGEGPAQPHQPQPRCQQRADEQG